jgi:hypothetical protein
MFQAVTTKHHILQPTRIGAATALAIPSRDRGDVQRLWQHGRQWAIATARKCYPIASTTAFIAASPIVTLAVMFTVVALILTVVLRFSIRITGFLFFRSSRKRRRTQPTVIVS